MIGVFIGIQVANWNDARADAEQQQIYLERLHADFRAIDNRLNEHFDIYGRMIEGFATPDVTEARDLLAELRGAGTVSSVP